MSSFSPAFVSFTEALLAFTAVSSLALGVRAVAFRALRRWARGTATLADDIILDSIRLPSMALCVLIGVYSAIYMARLSPHLTALALNITYATLVLSMTAAIANLLEATARQALKEKKLILPATDFSLSVLKVAIWIVGGLVLLSGLGVAITPMVAALGVGGLAVSLALQDTLSNFFAGIHLLIDKPIAMGDFVKLESGQEGYVISIGWRSTRLRMKTDDLVIIPNNKLTQSVVINYAQAGGEPAGQDPSGLPLR